MKKYLFLFIGFLMFPIFVNASSITCVYNYQSIEVSVYYNYGSQIRYEVVDNNGTYQVKEVNINNNDIISETGKIACPIVSATTKLVSNKKFEITFNPDASGDIIPTSKDYIYDGKESSSSNNHACLYKRNTVNEYSLVWNNNRVEVNLIGSNYENFCGAEIDTSTNFTASDFANGKCPIVSYSVNSRYQNGSGCVGKLIVSKNSNSTTVPEGSINVDTGEEIEIGTNSDAEIEDIGNCESLLGSPDDKDPASPAYYMSFAFSIIRYVAIILLIVLTMMDFVSAVASQDNDILKKAATKAVKRAILCVIIFVLPTLIDFVLQFIHDASISDCISLDS